MVSLLCTPGYRTCCLLSNPFESNRRSRPAVLSTPAHNQKKLQVRLSTAPPGGEGVSWCCQIKLRKEYVKDSDQRDPKPKEVLFKTLTQVCACAGMVCVG